MSEENSRRTNLPSSSAVSSDQPVVRPDSLTIRSNSISMDLLTPQILQFLQSCSSNAASAVSTPENKIFDSCIPELTKSLADTTAVSSSSVNLELPTPSTSVGGAAGGVQSVSTASAAAVTTPGIFSQNSFMITTTGGPADSSGNSQNYILFSPIVAAASSPTTAQLVLPSGANNVATVARNFLSDTPLVSKTTAFDMKPEIGGDLHQDIISSSTTSNAGIHDTSSLLDSDTNRPTRPSSSDSSLRGGSSQGRRRLTAPSSRPFGVGDTASSQLNRLEQKRARNRDAARRCRERKIRLIETLEKKVSQLSETNRQLQMELEQTQNEVDFLRQLVEQHFKPVAAGGCSLPLKG